MLTYNLPSHAKVAQTIVVSSYHLTEEGAAWIKSGEPICVEITDGVKVLVRRSLIPQSMEGFKGDDRIFLSELYDMTPVDFIYLDPDGPVYDGWALYCWDEEEEDCNE